MKKYKIEIKLLFEYFDINYSEIIKKKKYKTEPFEFEEPESKIKVIFNPDFVIQFENIICQNLDEAYRIINKLLLKICEILTLMIQIEIKDSDQWQPNLSYNISDAKVIEESDCQQASTLYKNNEDVISIIERFVMSESLALFITYELSMKLFPVLFSTAVSDTPVPYFMDILYRAMRCRDIESKYFTLFTIIEYIESKNKGIIEVNKIFNEFQIDEILDKTAEVLSETDLKIQKRIQNRLKQLLADATVETRAEKLCDIIKEKYALESISYIDVNYNIDSKKMSEFIDLRNKLFHGSESKYIDKPRLTNELLRLCMAIFQAELKI